MNYWTCPSQWIVSIGPDGTIYLPRLRALYVEGLTVAELRDYLMQQFSTYVRKPQLYVRPVRYRPIRVYVGGEVRRPGYYTISSGGEIYTNISETTERLKMQTKNEKNIPLLAKTGVVGSSLSTCGAMFPTVFDAIRCAQGITPYTDLSQVKVIRKRAEGLGGGHIKTTLNFLNV